MTMKNIENDKTTIVTHQMQTMARTKQWQW